MSVAFNREIVLSRGACINTKTAVHQIPVVHAVGAPGGYKVADVRTVRKDAVAGSVAELAAKAHRAAAALRSAALRSHQEALRFAGCPSDDVDDTIDRICAPDSGSWPTNDFNALDIL